MTHFDDPDEKDFPIVAIGASAGGLQALERFFTHTPTDQGLSYVVIQHLSANYKSMMYDLINRYTAMPISMIVDGMPLEKNHVYLISAGTIVEIKNRNFVVSDKSEKVLTLPIDIFFKSLAEDVGDKAIGVILSGTGSDGSRGALAVNAAGGFVLAQKPEEAKFDGMPRSAIATGVVDEVLGVEDIPNRIARFLHSPTVHHPPKVDAGQDPENSRSHEDFIQDIFRYLMRQFNIDFNAYKEATLLRRIERRMQVQHTASFQSYLQLLEENPSEVIALRRELLIPVTNFFRNPEVFEFLQRHCVDTIINQADSKDGIRIWVAGCSTGEEAYSLAILFLERISELKKWVPLKVFATDLNPEAIDFASVGLYPEAIKAEIPDHQLQRFFVRRGNQYSVANELRQAIVFAKHNLLSDAPFTKMDLVSCRNTLIYFKSFAQDVAQQKLKYATKEGCFLLLGKGEALSLDEKAFVSLCPKLKIYRCHKRSLINYVGSNPINMLFQRLERKGTPIAPPPSLTSTTEEGLKLLQSKFFPASMLINEKNEIVHVYQSIDNFIRLKTGSVSYAINQVLSDKLLSIITALLFRARKEGKPVSTDHILYDSLTDGTQHNITVHAFPLQKASLASDILLVIQENTFKVQGLDSPQKLDLDKASTQHILQLEQDLRYTRQSLLSTIEELETTNEELQATNEELMASNEELQSSNEELQSVNEELNTVNAEYHETMSMLSRMNSDLNAMSEANGIATIFLDEKLNLTRFSQAALEVFRLRDSDLGRPLEEITNKLYYPDIFEDVKRTLRTGITLEKQALNEKGAEFLIRIVHYNLASINMAGIVISFIDIMAVKTSERLQHLIDALPEHIAVLDTTGKIVLVNRAWKQFARANGDLDLKHTGLGCNYLDVCSTASDDPFPSKARKGIKAVLEGSIARFAMEYPCHSDTEKRWFAMEVVPIQDEPFRAVISHFNISAWKLKIESMED